jgi:Lectin C-type domain
MRFGRPPHARATTHLSLAAAVVCALSCLPSNDLSEYSAARTGGTADAGGASSSPIVSAPGFPEDLADTGGTGETPATGGASGAGEDVPVPSPVDAGMSPALGDAAPPACASDELQGPNDHCYFFDARTASWDAARSACQARGAGWDLASVRSAAESTFLARQLAFEAWIGASDAALEGTWLWVVDSRFFWLGNGRNGEALGGAYVNWNSSEPNGGAESDCARALPRSLVSPNPDARWADLSCDQLRAAVCEAFSAP